MFILFEKFFASRVSGAFILGGLSLALFSACGGDEGEAYSQLTAAISQGRPDSLHQAVGYLLVERTKNNSACTGTLVGQRTVLSAAHCFADNAEQGQVIQVVIIWDEVVPDRDDLSVTPTITRVSRERIFNHRQYQGAADGHQNDIAVLVLNDKPEGVVPAILSQEVPRERQQLAIVGYGKTSPDDPGDTPPRRRTGISVISSISASRIFLTPGTTGSVGSTCFGDSGGPSFANVIAKERVVSIHSISLDEAFPCRDVAETRVDTYIPWISAVANGDLEGVTTAGQNGAQPLSSSGAGQESDADGENAGGPALFACNAAAGPSIARSHRPIGSRPWFFGLCGVLLFAHWIFRRKAIVQNRCRAKGGLER